jgi:hypothetical protein
VLGGITAVAGEKHVVRSNIRVMSKSGELSPEQYQVALFGVAIATNTAHVLLFVFFFGVIVAIFLVVTVVLILAILVRMSLTLLLAL